MKRSWLVMAMLLSGCQAPGIKQYPGYSVDYHHQASGQEPRVQMIVIHYTAENNPDSLHILTTEKVSAHYLIPDPTKPAAGRADIEQLVPESQVAWHAGQSSWQGVTHLNNISVGIELVNRGYYRTSYGYRCDVYPARQIAVLTKLLRDIVTRYHIRPQNIVGHSDIAPLRKQDPGPCFPWQTLAQEGLGAWPDPQTVASLIAGRPPLQASNPTVLMGLLRQYGYGFDDSESEPQQQTVIKAFQMHFRPWLVSGKADVQTEAIARALLEKYGSPH
ncbi:N-acetylmuramoyl-L-alanine amidase [Tatumella citrea]|uniref:N-acetylmuramoyl-L-alanine amidase n=1 Tax=Tatumella citrea TaxID=53336 RepID=A0A1Y0L620_TATCI|nr:N-acetylmuramoyl-L-alanine amidase [Tatumella citrea]ARU93494.1 N-acetylmuramoyl-L-alanine amidase [Tatumella citrea]ARU97533.1 N-acetylmuramoyl-L-alanine amidase [Tatumella citrea]